MRLLWHQPSPPTAPLVSQCSIVACIVTLLLTACGDLFGTSSTPDPSAPPNVFIFIDGNTFRPLEATIPVGGFVTFGTDTAPHEIYSDPHPSHTSCPQLNVGLIPRLSNRRSEVLNTAGVCRFHDDTQQPDDTSLHGTIRIQ